jgi:hypothetical protein
VVSIYFLSPLRKRAFSKFELGQFHLIAPDHDEDPDHCAKATLLMLSEIKSSKLHEDAWIAHVPAQAAVD